MSEIISIDKLLIGYGSKSSGCAIMAPITTTVNRGEFICLIGENGMGKSTLLKTLSGNIKPLSGMIKINRKFIEDFDSQELSTQLSLVLTDKITIGLITVFDLVAFGRYPFTNWIAKLSSYDRKVVSEAIDLCGIAHLSDRYFSNLSDGEKQKVLIARAIAQQTPLILLDEPLNHLDLINKVEIFSLLQRLSKTINSTIIISTHQVELALQAADKLWLITNEHQLEVATPDEAVNSGLFNKAFKSEQVIFDPITRTFQLKSN
jgi:iron complex transport system ATP-binding protein